MNSDYSSSILFFWFFSNPAQDSDPDSALVSMYATMISLEIVRRVNEMNKVRSGTDNTIWISPNCNEHFFRLRPFPQTSALHLFNSDCVHRVFRLWISALSLVSVYFFSHWLPAGTVYLSFSTPIPHSSLVKIKCFFFMTVAFWNLFEGSILFNLCQTFLLEKKPWSVCLQEYFLYYSAPK